MTYHLSPLVLEKLREQVERLDHLLALIPPGALTSPAPPIRNAMPLDMLLGHLLECLAGVCFLLSPSRAIGRPEGFAPGQAIEAQGKIGRKG